MMILDRPSGLGAVVRLGKAQIERRVPRRLGAFGFEGGDVGRRCGLRGWDPPASRQQQAAHRVPEYGTRPTDQHARDSSKHGVNGDRNHSGARGRRAVTGGRHTR